MDCHSGGYSCVALGVRFSLQWLDFGPRLCLIVYDLVLNESYQTKFWKGWLRVSSSQFKKAGPRLCLFVDDLMLNESHRSSLGKVGSA